MNPTLKNNQRVTYLRDLPSAITLHAYIQKLDAKYNVNSKDHENSFGDITLDNPIIKNGVDNTLFLAKISTNGFFSESDLCKYIGTLGCLPSPTLYASLLNRSDW